MNVWPAGQIQLVWFTSEAAAVTADEVFAKLTNSEPDTSQRTKAGPATLPSSSASGVIGDLHLATTVQPGRIDAIVRSRPQPLPGGIVIGDTENALGNLIKMASSASGLPNEVARLALVMTLMEPTPGPSQAAKLVNEKLGGIVKFPDSTDLTFSVNRRKSMTFNDNVLMNRLFRFSVESIQEVQVVNGTMMPNASDVWVASHMIDLNIVPTKRTFSPEEQALIWNEMAVEAMRLRSVGTLAGLEDD